MVKESEIQRAILALLSETGLTFWRQNLGGILQMSNQKLILKSNPMTGFPDICGLTPTGQFWAMELKTPKGRVSIQQDYWMRKLRRSGAIVAVIRSVGEAEEFLSQLKSE